MPSIARPLNLPPRSPSDAPDAPKLCSGHWSLGAGYHVCRSRGTTTGLLFYTVSGQGFFRSRSGAIHLSGPGELTWYDPNVEQEYGTLPTSGRPWDFHWTHVAPRAPWTTWLRLRPVPGMRGLRAGVPLPEHTRTRVEAAWAELHQDVRLADPWHAELAINLAERILLLGSEASDPRGGGPLDERIQRAVELIAREPAAPHSVGRLARAVGLSPSRFAHLFRQQTGLPVLETVIRTRMREAEQLLGRTTEPVSAIGYRLGFATPQHFSAQFRKWYGISPRDYRARGAGSRIT